MCLGGIIETDPWMYTKLQIDTSGWDIIYVFDVFNGTAIIPKWIKIKNYPFRDIFIYICII